MKPAELLQVRAHSPAFLDARVRRLLVDTLHEYGQLSVVYSHVIVLDRADLDQADLDISIWRRKRCPSTLQVRRVRLLAFLIKTPTSQSPCLSPCTPKSIQPPEAK